MHLLILTPALPYPTHQGGALRNFGLIRGLAEHGYQITLLSFSEKDVEASKTPLADYCEKIETVPILSRSKKERIRDLILKPQPDLALRLESNVFREKLQALLKETAFDVVHFEGLEMAIYLPLVQALQPKAKRIYDAHNAEFSLQKAISHIDRKHWKRFPAAVYSTIQAHRIAYFEKSICENAHAVICVSSEDREALKTLAPKSKFYVIPNGIYTADYLASEQNSDPNTQNLDLGEYPIVFTGKMDYRPNIDAIVWMANNILPLIQEKIHGAKLIVVGQKPPHSIQALNAHHNIEITGWVPAVQPYLYAARAYVAPLRMGSGTRLKLLEAFAAGCATVATPLAAAGLESAMDDVFVRAETAETFADAVIHILQDDAYRKILGEKAQKAVQTYYDWQNLIPLVVNYHQEVLGG